MQARSYSHLVQFIDNYLTITNIKITSKNYNIFEHLRVNIESWMSNYIILECSSRVTPQCKYYGSVKQTTQLL